MEQQEQQQQSKSHINNSPLALVAPSEPCQVCGRKSTGHHYGAVTCEACKAFFKRTVHSCVTYFCPVLRSGARCPVPQSGRKRHCPACRWVRCLEARMQTALVRCASPAQRATPEAAGAADTDVDLDQDGQAASVSLASAGGGVDLYSADASLVDAVDAAAAAAANATPAGDGAAAAVVAGREPPAFMQSLAALKPAPGDQAASDGSALVSRLTELLSAVGSGSDTDGFSSSIGDAEVATASGSGLQADEQTALLGLATNRLAFDLIDFAKRLAEFGQLPMEDRVRLLQLHWLSLVVWQVAYNSTPYDGSLKLAANYAVREDQASSIAGLIPVRCGSQMRCLARVLTGAGLTWAEFLLLKLVFLFDPAPPLDEWRRPDLIEAAQAAYLNELRAVCPDNARRGKLLSMSSMLSAIQVFSIGYWSRVLQRTTFLPPPLMSEMLTFSLGQVPRISSDLSTLQGAAAAASAAATSEC